MTHAATPAAEPATPAPATVMEADPAAPPTIDSHGGKLTPITCFCAGPDGPTSLLMMLALLSALAPRTLKAFGRQLHFPAVRLVPGLLLTTLLAWNQLPSLEPAQALPSRFDLVAPLTAILGGALLAISFLRLLSDALMPLDVRSKARSVAAMTASALAVLALPPTAGIDIVSLMNGDPLRFNWTPVLAGYLGVPTGLVVLLAWRRFDGRLFDALLLVGTVGLLFLGGVLLSAATTSILVFLAVTFTVAAGLGAGWRGMGAPGWRDLTGRMAWVLSWVLLVLSVIAIGSWVLL